MSNEAFWLCPSCKSKIYPHIQRGHNCPLKKENKKAEKLIGRPNEDLGYRYFPSSKEEWDL